MRALVLELAGIDGRRKPILLRRQWAGREAHEAAGTVGLPAAGLIGEHHEQLAIPRCLQKRIQAPGMPRWPERSISMKCSEPATSSVGLFIGVGYEVDPVSGLPP